MASYLPPEWPSPVDAPGTDDFELTAVAWLLDVLPEGYREQKRARRYPVGLAVIAKHHTEAVLAGTRDAYRSIRSELEGLLPPSVIEDVLAVYRAEGPKHASTATAAGLVARALFERGFRPLS